MQNDLESSFPQLGIEILGVNDWALSVGSEGISQQRDIPWLQDVDSDGDGVSDLWSEWGVNFRDVVILNANNERVDAFNLTAHNLSDPQSYTALRQMFVAAAVPEPSTIHLLGLGAMALFTRCRRGRARSLVIPQGLKRRFR